MFLERETFVAADWLDGSPADQECVVTPAAAYVPSGGRYGEGRKSSFSGMALAVGVHLAALPVLLGLGYQASVQKEERLVAVNLTPPAPPPPAAQPEKPQQRKLETKIIPPPIQLATPVTQPLVLAVADAPALMQTAAITAPPAPPAPPVPPAPPSIVSSDSLGARMVAGSPPRYPVECRRRKEQGTVELLLILGIDGAVEAISVAKSSGFARLDDAALSAVRRWRWQPTSRNGAPVKVRGVVEIPFVLKSA
ncbi:energy transducer TonB [Novosphingobium sp. 17-62-19]|uniref:energy transducer TonB n=1 Tax=Novosphingobium sp. 17-62-19 TaxID=1970406 RepID=UPI0025DF7217|nr:energy transducer TonB [Novosphingobium sp. 17-62-19]HQS97533.1 energy transducer TonB [Novosphingobium sp.]